ncbi:hypothetical protein HDV03_004045 [Kappamyces sp. JEL0829]|nr:hypothetical protein HDV03_004045 [Kappamyces sp. JEL0829]
MQFYTYIALLSIQAHARFGQQNPPVQGKVAGLQGLSQNAGTLSGQIPSTLLGGADPCAKLTLADTIAKAGGLDAAKDLVNTESNFNPFTQTGPKFCQDPALPATPELRGILAQVSDSDLKVPFGANGGLNSEAINKIAATSRITPIANNAGKSVAQLYADAGFKDQVGFTGAVSNAPAATNPPATQTQANGDVTMTVTATVTVNSCAATATGLAGSNNAAGSGGNGNGNGTGANTDVNAGTNAGANNGQQATDPKAVFKSLADLVNQMQQVISKLI